MPGSQALLYCAVNGIANCTNGVGRQTKTFLATLRDHYASLAAEIGEFVPYLAVPAPSPATWGYDPHDLAYSRATVERLGGRVFALPYDTAGPFWHPDTWHRLCGGAAQEVSSLAATHDRVLTLAIDTPFAGLATTTAAEASDLVLALFSTAQITERPHPDPAHIGWEQRALTAANVHRRVRVADIGSFLTDHLRREYAVHPSNMVSWPSGLHLTDADLSPLDTAAAQSITRQYGIFTDRPIVAVVGRTDRTKGIDVLIEAVAPLRDHVQLVAIAVPTDDERAGLVDTYRARCNQLGLRATIVGQYSRDLPRALAAHPSTCAMVVPSRGETLANIVFETALWARHDGAIILAPARDGFLEQIVDGQTGLLYEPTGTEALSSGVRRALALTRAERTAIRTAAAATVLAERDASKHLATLLTQVWPPPPPATR